MEKLFNRAKALLAFMDEADAARHLVNAGVAEVDAFFAVKAAAILLREA